jgi:hydroxypyruvate reductase
LLLHAGANIHELNAVRSLLSQVKGGGLRRVVGPARCVSLLLSDVLGNDPGVIASGPTIPMTPSPERAREIIRRYSLEDRLPHAAMTLIHQDSPTGDDPDLGKDDVRAIVADNATFVAETERLFRREGLMTSVVWRAFDGDASDLGRRIVEGAEAAADDVDVLLGGGEATVEVTGNGIGGRNTEAALVAAMELERSDASWVIASLASDGQDGASEATGAIADPETCARARAVAVDAESALRNNDSATFFERSGGLVVTGPSGTNVNDVYIALRVRNEGKQ